MDRRREQFPKGARRRLQPGGQRAEQRAWSPHAVPAGAGAGATRMRKEQPDTSSRTGMAALQGGWVGMAPSPTDTGG